MKSVWVIYNSFFVRYLRQGQIYLDSISAATNINMYYWGELSQLKAPFLQYGGANHDGTKTWAICTESPFALSSAVFESCLFYFAFADSFPDRTVCSFSVSACWNNPLTPLQIRYCCHGWIAGLGFGLYVIKIRNNWMHVDSHFCNTEVYVHWLSASATSNTHSPSGCYRTHIPPN